MDTPAVPRGLSMVCCDLDGTLAWTDEANVEAYRVAFEAEGLPFDESAYRRAFGLRFDAMMDALAPGSTADRRSRVKAAKAEAYRGAMGLVEPNHALLGLLRVLKGSVPLALATTASEPNALCVLEAIGASGLFDAMVFGGDVARSKPHPDCHLEALRRLGLPEGSPFAVFEDSEVGVASAIAAGGQVFLVPPRPVARDRSAS